MHKSNELLFKNIVPPFLFIQEVNEFNNKTLRKMIKNRIKNIEKIHSFIRSCKLTYNYTPSSILEENQYPNK